MKVLRDFYSDLIQSSFFPLAMFVVCFLHKIKFMMGVFGLSSDQFSENFMKICDTLHLFDTI